MINHRRLATNVITAAALLAGTPATSRSSHVPITWRTTSGTRPYAPVVLDGKPFLFMVHGGADAFAMTTHANAAKAGVTDLVQKGRYGIKKIGEVSSLGRADATAKTFAIGGVTTRDMPLQVFEIPQDPPVDGMVGIRWLRASKTFVDFAKSELIVPEGPTDADAERATLLKQGYVAHPMTWDAAVAQYAISAVVNGAPATMRVGTVSDDFLDEPFARAHGLALVQQDGTYGGPTGTTGHFYKTTVPYSLTLNGKPLLTDVATVFDTYAYEAKPRPTTGVLAAGTFGADFMRRNQAVIDFGSGTLFLKV